MLKFIYTIFLGLILALFIGLGVSTFYESPKAPEYPTHTMEIKQPGDDKAYREYDEAYKAYEAKVQPYNRNVSIITLVAAIVLLVAGFVLERRNAVISGGFVLGGLFTLVYSIIRGFVSTDTKYTFIVVSLGVVIALYLGYRNFSHQQPEKRPVKKK